MDVRRVSLVWILSMWGCAQSTGGGVEPSTLQRAGCEYLQRCFDGVTRAFPGGTLDGCLHDRGCVETLAPSEPDTCVAVLREDDCAFPLATSPSFGSGLTFGGVSIYVPFNSPCGQRLGSTPATQTASIGEACVSREGGCEATSTCASDNPLRFVGARVCGQCRASTPTGQACADEDRCAEGSCVDGVCARRPRRGEACEFEGQCIYPNSCNVGVCEPVSPECDGHALGTPCNGTAIGPCGGDPTLACVDEVCVVRPDLGQVCDRGLDCRGSLHCTDGRCAPPTCERSLNETCGPRASCADGLFCGLNATCVTGAREGEPCDDGCGPPLQCDFGTRVCHALRDLGAPCDIDFQCMSQHCARDLSTTCTRRPDGSVSCSIALCDGCGTCSDEVTNADCAAP